MRLDFSQCKTPEDVERIPNPLGETMAALRAGAERAGFWLGTSDEPAARAYRDGRLHAALIRAATMARVAWGCGDVTVMTEALEQLTAAEDACGVDLTSPRDQDLEDVKPRRARRKARRR